MQTDMKKLIVAFRIANASKKWGEKLHRMGKMSNLLTV